MEKESENEKEIRKKIKKENSRRMKLKKRKMNPRKGRGNAKEIMEGMKGNRMKERKSKKR